MHRAPVNRWILCSTVLLLGLRLAGQPPETPEGPLGSWPRALGGPERETALGVAVDGKGGSYVIGQFQGSSTFGTITLAGSGLTDVFVAKLDRQGQVLWARAFGGPGADEGHAIAADSAGNVAITGSFSGAVDFDPGAGRTELTSAGGSDAFLLRLTPDGDLAWARRLGGKLADAGTRVAVGAKGETWVAGSFQGSMEGLDSAGKTDAFLARFDEAGSLSWARRIGGLKDDEARGVAAGRNGEVWVAGNFEETAGIGPSGGTLNLQSAGRSDVFVLRLDAAGTLAFSGRIGGPQEESLGSAAAAGAGGLALAGRFSGTVDFDPGPGSLSRAAAGPADAFIARLEGTGRLAWARQFGERGSDSGAGVAGNREGSVVATGHLGGGDDFDFVIGYSPKGDPSWSLQLSASEGLEAPAVALSAGEIPYVAGSFKGQTAALRETGAEPVKAAGKSDAFVWRLVPKGPALRQP
jgi:hypothetical protein